MWGSEVPISGRIQATGDRAISAAGAIQGLLLRQEAGLDDPPTVKFHEGAVLRNHWLL